MKNRLTFAMVCLFGLGVTVSAGQQSDASKDSAYLDTDGTAHLTRVIPVPHSVSSEAQRSLAKQVKDPPIDETLPAKRIRTDAYAHSDAEAYRAMYRPRLRSRR